MRTCIKSRTSSNFDQIGQLTTELAALECLKISHRLVMGKWCVHASSFIFYQIVIKVAGNQDRHKSSDEFDFGPLVSMAYLYVFEMRFDLGTLDSGERSLPFGLLVSNLPINLIDHGQITKQLEIQEFSFFSIRHRLIR